MAIAQQHRITSTAIVSSSNSMRIEMQVDVVMWKVPVPVFQIKLSLQVKLHAFKIQKNKVWGKKAV